MQRLTFFFTGLFCIGIVFADDDSAVSYDRVSLSVSAEKYVANDKISAQMYAEREGEDVSQIASEVNQSIAWALDVVRGVDEVTAQTTDYYSHPVYREQTAIGWRTRQSIKLESRNAAQLSQLIGELQQRLALSSLSYSVSHEVRAREENALITRALSSFQQRAQLITKQLGRSNFRIVHIDVVTADAPHPQHLSRMAVTMEAADSTASPAIESGVQIVQVRINGTIELKLN